MPKRSTSPLLRSLPVEPNPPRGLTGVGLTMLARLSASFAFADSSAAARSASAS